MSDDMGEVPIARQGVPPIDSPHMTQAHPIDLGGKVAGEAEAAARRAHEREREQAGMSPDPQPGEGYTGLPPLAVGKDWASDMTEAARAHMDAARTGEMVPDAPMPVLGMGEMPTFWAGGPTWRNGREAGAHLCGIVLTIPEKQAHVTVPDDYADGAIIAMVRGGLTVTPFSGGGGSTTLAVRVADCRWGPDPEQ